MQFYFGRVFQVKVFYSDNRRAAEGELGGQEGHQKMTPLLYLCKMYIAGYYSASNPRQI
jgi:hypothetical protein